MSSAGPAGGTPGASALVLIRSPLVGRSFWSPVARVLASRAVRCVVPAIAAHDREPVPWRSWPTAVLEEIGEDGGPGPVVVGHSAAGFLLPAIARKLRARAVIFVDASIPPDSGAVPPADAEFLRFVRGLPLQAGLLPRWSEWWGQGAIERIVGDPRAFRSFEAELPRLPLAWFDDQTAVPAWRDLPAAYLQTSARFAAVAADAAQRTWPVRALAGTHLHPLLEPVATADALCELVQALA